MSFENHLADPFMASYVRRRSSSCIDPRMARLKETSKARRSSLFSSCGHAKASPLILLAPSGPSTKLDESNAPVEYEVIGIDGEENKRLLSLRSDSVREAKAVLKEGIKLKHITSRSKISVLRRVDPAMSHFLQKRRIQTIQHLANTTLPQVHKLATESEEIIPVSELDKVVSDAYQLVSALRTLNPILTSNIF